MLAAVDFSNMIPEFRPDGYLPEGIHIANESEVTFRFGSATPRRRRLVLRLRQWLELARKVKATRLLLDGSFVTSKAQPDDIDAVVLLPPNFLTQILTGSQPAIELEQMLLTRRPEELFAAEDQTDWEDWVQFFSRTREQDGRQKGLVEVML